MRLKHKANINEKIDTLKRDIKQPFCEIIKQFAETCEKLFEKLKIQIKNEFTNELNNCDERIKQLEADKVMIQKHIL